MSVTPATKFLLIVEDPKQLTLQHQAIHKHLAEDMKLAVEMRGFMEPLTDTGTFTAIVVLAKDVAKELREAKVPILVCNAEALYDLGMTRGKADVDYGEADYCSIAIAPEAVRHPVTNKIGGRPKVTESTCQQGWGKPGAHAFAAATIHGDSGKAVIFAYEQGADMPTCEAAHRRATFLASGGPTSPLTTQGWLLFDAVFAWVCEGGKDDTAEADANEQAQWFLKDGSPTKVLSVQEYREWTEEKIFYRLIKSVIGIGVGTFLTLLFAINGCVTKEVNEKVGDLDKKINLSVTAQVNSMSQAVNSRLDTATQTVNAKVDATAQEMRGNFDKEAEKQTVKVAAQIAFNPAVAEQINKSLTDKANETVKNLLKNKETRETIANALIEQITSEGLAAHLLKKLKEKDGERNPEVRKFMLTFALVFSDPVKRASMRPDLMRFIVEASEGEPVRNLALTAYAIPADPEQAQKDLDIILANLEVHSLRQGLGAGLSESAQAAYERFFAAFPDDFAIVLQNKLKALHANRSPAAPLLVRSLASMAPHSGKPSQALAALVDLIRDDGTRDLGIEGLNGFASTNPAAARSEDRGQGSGIVETLFRLFKDLDKDEKLKDILHPGFKTKLRNAIVSLLRAEDGAVLQEKLMGTSGENLPVQAILGCWVDKLQIDGIRPKILDELVNSVTSKDGCFSGEGNVKLIELHWLTHDPDGVKKFFELLVNKPPSAKSPNPNSGQLSVVYENSRINGEWPRVMARAVQRDAGERRPFAAMIDALVALANAPRDDANHAARREIELAMQKFKNETLELGHLKSMYDVLQRPEVKATKALGDLFENAKTTLRARFDKEARVDGHWDLDQKQDYYAWLATVDPENPQVHAERGLFLHEKLGEHDKALTSLDAAIEWGKKSSEIERDKKQADRFARKGDVLIDLGERRAQDAVVAYLEALKLGGSDKENTLAHIHRKLGKAFIYLKDKKNAEFHTNKTIELTPTLRDKAGAKENLGLLYLRSNDPKAALEHAKEVDKMDRYLAWNWAIRFFAAKDLQNEPEALMAHKQWESLRMPNNFADLYRFVPEHMEKYLNVKSVTVATLKNKARVGVKNEQVHDLLVQAGKKYVIDMESSVFDTYLILEGPQGQKLFDDDSGGGLNARLTFVTGSTHLPNIAPINPGNYRIVATSFRTGAHGKYALIIRELPKDR